MKTFNNILIRKSTACLAAVLFLAASNCFAVTGSLKEKNGAVHTGTIRYKKISQMYVVKKAQGIESQVALRNVIAKKITKPKTLEPAIQKVQAGQHSSAVPALETILRDYDMLQWDVVAARWLAECYLKQNKVAEANRLCAKVKNSGTELSADFLEVYTRGLIAAKKYADLRKVLVDMVATGSRDLAAMAQVKRGDMEMKEGRYKDALRDGYLRTVYLFQETKSVRAEALYKASKCFAEIGQTQYAEKMRKSLLREFPNSEYSKKANSGT